MFLHLEKESLQQFPLLAANLKTLGTDP